MYSKRALLSRGNSQLYLPKVCRYSRVSSGLIKSLDNLLRHIRTASERFEFPAVNEYTTDKSSGYGRNFSGLEGRGWNSPVFHQNQNEQRLNPREGLEENPRFNYDRNPVGETRGLDENRGGGLHQNPNRFYQNSDSLNRDGFLNESQRRIAREKGKFSGNNLQNEQRLNPRDGLEGKPRFNYDSNPVGETRVLDENRGGVLHQNPNRFNQNSDGSNRDGFWNESQRRIARESGKLSGYNLLNDETHLNQISASSESYSQNQSGAYGERGRGIQDRNHGETAQKIYERTTIPKIGGGSDSYYNNNVSSLQNPNMVHTHMQNQTWGHNHSGHGQTPQFPSSFNQQAQYPGNPNWNGTQNTGQTWGNKNVGNAEMNPWNWQNQSIGQHQPDFTYQNGTPGSQVSTNPESQADLAQASENEMPESQDNIKVEELDRFCKERKLKDAVELLGQLVNKGSVVDLPRLLQLVQLCGEEEALQEAKSVHEHIVASVPHIEITTYNSIIEMYSKCESMDDASSVFEKMSERNLETWDLMIRWLAKNGSGEEAIDLFTRFKQEGNKPNGQIYTGVFTACGVLGDVTEGMLHFKVMCEEYGIVPSMEHYVGLVEMFATTGYLDEAWEFIERMPMEPSVEVWETLMNLSRTHGSLEIGDRCCEMIEILDPSRLNEQSKSGFLPVKTVDFAKEKQKKMLIGQNPLEIRSRVHEYRAGDTSHPENKRIYALLRCLKAHMVEMGYIAETRFVLHDVDHESKEEALLSHSERLAFAHGLLTTSARSSIRVIKNLRVCVDCHNALKIISKIVGREFIMRDAKRFHHLKDGVCSCRDYW